MQHPDEGTIHAWLDDALPPDEAARIEAHVAGCAACGAAVAEARGLIAASTRILAVLDSVPRGVIPASAPATAGASAGQPAATPDTPDTVRRAGTVTPIARRPRWRSMPMRAAAALLVTVVGGVAVLRSVARDESGRAETAVFMEVADIGVAESPPSYEPVVVFAQVPGSDAEQQVMAQILAPRRGEPRPGQPGSRAETDRAAVGEAFGTDGVAAATTAASSAIAGSAASARAPAPPPASVSSAAGLADRDAATRQATERRAARTLRSTGTATEAAVPPALTAPTAPMRNDALAADLSVAAAPSPDDEAAPMIRRPSGWTVLGSAVVRDAATLVRRTTYRVPSGAQVTLEESVVRDTISISARSRAAVEAREEATMQAAAAEPQPRPAAKTAAPTAGAAASVAQSRERAATNVLRWAGERGTSLSLSGPVDVRTLEALREEIRRSAARP